MSNEFLFQFKNFTVRSADAGSGAEEIPSLLVPPHSESSRSPRAFGLKISKIFEGLAIFHSEVIRSWRFRREEVGKGLLVCCFAVWMSQE